MNGENGRWFLSEIGVGDDIGKKLWKIGLGIKCMGERELIVEREKKKKGVEKKGIFEVERIDVRGIEWKIEWRMVGKVEIENMGEGKMEKMIKRKGILRKWKVEKIVDGELDDEEIVKRRKKNGEKKREVERIKRKILRMEVGIVGKEVERGVILDKREKKEGRKKKRRKKGEKVWGDVDISLRIFV